MATEVVHSLRSTGGDYSSFADWQTAQARDLVLADEIAVLECYDDWPSGLLEQITFSGWTTDPDHPIIIRAAAGHEANGRLPGTAAFSGFYATYDTAATGPFNYTTEHLILEGIGIVKSAGGATPNALSTGENTRVRRCTIYHQPAVSTSAVVLTGPTSSSGTVFIEALSNCIVYSNTSNDLVRVNSSRTVDSCTLVSLNGAAQAGVYSLNISHNGRVRNTAVFNAAAIYSNGGNDGTNNLLAASGDFVDYAGNDYSIANDSVLAKAGTNPLTTASDADDWNDITGKTRAYWDIGAFAAPASLAENTHLATFTTRPTDTGASGGPNVAGTETNYPGYIDLSEAPQALWDAVTSGGGDIRVFENQAGGLVELPAEVVSCDTSAETGELHYLLPSISASTPQEIRLYADGVSSRYDHADPFGRNAVWGDYEAVVHGGSATDSTGNHTVTANNSPTVTSGKVGDSYNFNGSNQSLNLGDITALDAASELSVSAWVKPDTLVANNTILARWGSSLQFLFGSPSNGANLQFAVDTPTSVFSSTGVFTAGSWTHAVGTWIGGGAVALYADGASLATAGNNNTLTLRSVASDVGIAYRAETSNYYYDGDVEEARIRISALSPQWIPTENNNQSDPSLFYTATDPNAGGSESISPDSLYQSVSIEGVTLTQAHVLAAANLAQLQAIGAATLAQANSIAPHGVDQTAGIESATLTQAHIIAPAGISQHQQIGTASLVSAGVLSVFGLAQTQTLDEAILTVAGALDVDGVSQSQVLEALTLVQNNILAPAGLAQEAALEATTINAAALGITPAGIEQVMAIDPTGLTQYHVLAVSDLAQDQILEAARFGGLVIGELQGRIYVFAALDGDVYAIPALTGTIH
jgi:hypothetical protein